MSNDSETGSEAKLAWGKVGDELSSLGLKLKLHASQEFSDDGSPKGDDAQSGDSRSELKETLQRLAEAIDSTVDAVGNVASDPAVREDLKESGQLLVNALAVTIEQAVEGIKTAVSPDGPDSPADDASPPSE